MFQQVVVFYTGYSSFILSLLCHHCGSANSSSNRASGTVEESVVSLPASVKI